MKRLLTLLLLCLFVIAGCGSSNSVAPVPVSSAPTESAPTEPETAAPTENKAGPTEDEDLSRALSQKMQNGFGTEGAETSWYKYIDNLQVFIENDSYYGVMTITEQPADRSLNLLMPQYYSGQLLEAIIPVLLDTGAALELDDIETCLVGELVYNISQQESGVEIYYYSLSSLGVPVFRFIAEAAGVSESDVSKSADDLGGSKFAGAILDAMAAEYQGCFAGLTQGTLKTMSLAAITNFDPYLGKMEIYDLEGKNLGAIENTLSPKS